MRCARCQRPMLQAAYRDGPFAWGPKCAKAAGFQLESRARQSPHTKDDAQMPLQLTMPPDIQPGHKYRAQGIDADLIAIEPKHGAWRLREIDGEWLGSAHLVFAGDLERLPMKYFHGATPA